MYISSHTLRTSNKTLNESDQQCHNADKSEIKKNGEKKTNPLTLTAFTDLTQCTHTWKTTVFTVMYNAHYLWLLWYAIHSNNPCTASTSRELQHAQLSVHKKPTLDALFPAHPHRSLLLKWDLCNLSSIHFKNKVQQVQAKSTQHHQNGHLTIIKLSNMTAFKKISAFFLYWIEKQTHDITQSKWKVCLKL